MSFIKILKQEKYKVTTYLRFVWYFYLNNMKRLTSGKIGYEERFKVNQPLYCSGFGLINIGAGCVFGFKMGGFRKGGNIEFQSRVKTARILIGNKVAFNNNAFLCSANLIKIGDQTRIGLGAIMTDHDAHGVNPNERNRQGEIGFIEIGRNVWIGNNVQFLKNSGIGDNGIVGAGAVVTKVFPANVVIGGVPAKIIRKL